MNRNEINSIIEHDGIEMDAKGRVVETPNHRLPPRMEPPMGGSSGFGSLVRHVRNVFDGLLPYNGGAVEIANTIVAEVGDVVNEAFRLAYVYRAINSAVETAFGSPALKPHRGVGSPYQRWHMFREGFSPRRSAARQRDEYWKAEHVLRTKFGLSQGRVSLCMEERPCGWMTKVINTVEKAVKLNEGDLRRLTGLPKSTIYARLIGVSGKSYVTDSWALKTAIRAGMVKAVFVSAVKDDTLRAYVHNVVYDLGKRVPYLHSQDLDRYLWTAVVGSKTGFSESVRSLLTDRCMPVVDVEGVPTIQGPVVWRAGRFVAKLSVYRDDGDTWVVGLCVANGDRVYHAASDWDARRWVEKERIRVVTEKTTDRLVRRLQNSPEVTILVTRNDSYVVGNCRPGTEAFIRSQGWHGYGVDAIELLNQRNTLAVKAARYAIGDYVARFQD